jgi:rhamnosyltransferase
MNHAQGSGSKPEPGPAEANYTLPLTRLEGGRLCECAAVVVTYFPTAENLKNVQAISRQFGLTIVVDNNSPAAARTQLQQNASEDKNIVLVLWPTNAGLAAACNAGIRLAQERGFTWAATFDQDTTVPDDFSAKVAAGVGLRLWPANVGLFAPRHIHPKSGRASAYAPTVRRGEGFTDISAAIQSGCIFNLKAFAASAGFAEELFIDYVDYEYSFRLKKRGYRLIQLDNALLVHEVGEKQYRKMLGLPIRIPVNVHSPVRQYYLLRNRVYVILRYGFRHLNWTFRELTHGTAVLIALLLTDKEGRQCLKFALRGIRDAITGKLGKLEP